MPVFSELPWPFQSTATPPESTHKTSSAHPLTDGTDIAQDGNIGACSMSAAPDNKQADMEVTPGFGVDGVKDIVESVDKKYSVQKANTAQEVGGAVHGGTHETLASVTALVGDNDGDFSRTNRPAGDLTDGKDGGQAHSQEPGEGTDPIHREHGIDSAQKAQGEGVLKDHKTDQPRLNGADDSRSHIKSEMPEDEQMTELNPADDKRSQAPNTRNEPGVSERADVTPRQGNTLPSSPLPTYSFRSGGQTYGPANHDEPRSEPSSDDVFMQQLKSHFGDQSHTIGGRSVMLEGTPKDLCKSAVEFHHDFNKTQNSQHAHRDLAGSANPSQVLREVSHKEKLPSGIRDENSGRLDNIRHKAVSRGPTDEAPWNDLQQPRSMPQPPYHSSPSSRGTMHTMYSRQIFLPQFAPSASNDAYGLTPFSSMQGNQMLGRAMHEQRASAQPVREDRRYTQVAAKRKRQEESDEDEQEPDEEDNYYPSESGDDEDSDAESNSGSDADVSLMYRKQTAEAARRKRAASSHSEYLDEGVEEQDEEQDNDQQEERDAANEEAKVASQEIMEPVQHMDVDTRNPTQDLIGNALKPPHSLTIKLALPSALAAGPTAIQRALPVLQPEVVPEAPPSDEISFKLPQYHVEVMPLKTKDDYPEVRVNLPGMIRENLILTPDHAYQEIHLLNHLFMPGQQSLVTPDPEPMVALLNFHTIATIVLEAYTSYEVGDLEVKTSASSSSSSKKNKDTEALDATKDEIFFAVMDRWRVGLAGETLRPSYKLIRGVQEFCDIALDVIYYLEEHGFVEGPQMMQRERSDKGVKKDKDGKGGKKANAGSGSDQDDVDEESTLKKRGRPAKGEVNALQARKKPKTTPTPKPRTKKQPKVKKEPGIVVIPRTN
ncbi:hypothetical protein PMIN06_001850 [Paraphaeosphaeria minitans]|uniref:Uncharacterized protein n=1 Tax=Paraphaeosphaeria minitans TaxID=565426 RepID=A0A9P6GK25_9PLEO|nr:hypothetical protein PMIN01_04870 [Paraphaeosphaeria minitans]